MGVFDIVLVVLAIGFVGLSLLPKLRENIWWNATITPLASIIGSGYLVIAPLLAAIAGSYALAAMLAIVVLAYGVGHIIRYNIEYAEPAEASSHAPQTLVLSSKLASISLSVAYVISVAFYIRLLASFAFSLTPFSNGLYENILTSAILMGIAAVGFRRGLRGLEKVEIISVSINLSIILALLIGLFWHNFGTGVWWANLKVEDTDMLTRLRMLGGMLLVVQGFETSRYLGAKYSAKMRRKTMNYAQISSAIIYLVFIALVVPVLIDLPAGKPSSTAIIDISGFVAPVLPYLLVLAALMSQLSAGIADTAGAGGLMVEETKGRVSERRAYPVLIALSIALIWAFDIFQVISIASRTFAFYYMMQAFIAAMVARKNKHYGQMAFALVLAVILALIVVFALPAG